MVDTKDLLFKFLAIYGAIMSSIGIFLSVLNYRRDRAKIKLKISADRWQQDSATIHILVVNEGRRPISIKKGLLENVNEGARDITFSPPIELTEYKSYSWSAAIPNFYKNNLEVKDLYAYVIDATYKKHWSDNIITRIIKSYRYNQKIHTKH